MNRLAFGLFVLCMTMLCAHLHGAVAMGTMDGNQPLIDFTQMGQVNPSVTVGGTTVHFGSIFLGQTLGTMPNELINSQPTGPLQLDPNGPNVTTLFEITAMEVVLGGSDNGSFLTTPLAIFFEDPVKDVFFDLGHLDAAGTTKIEAFDVDGNSLGMFSNPSAGWQTIQLADSSGMNLIAGISIYVPEHGMDWEGFAIDRIGFSFSDDGGGTGGGPDGEIPEPATLVIWAGFIFMGIVGFWWKKRRTR